MPAPLDSAVAAGARRPRWTSVEVQLPLLICALLALIVSGVIAWSYSLVRSKLLGSADVKLESAVAELGRIASLSTQPLIDLVDDVARDPAVQGALADPAPERIDAARSALARLSEVGAQSHVIELWSADGEKVATAAGAEPGVAGAYAFAPPEATGFQPLLNAEGASLRSYVHAVEDEAGERVGYVAMRTQVRRRPQELEALRNLLGFDPIVLYGNRDDATWTDGDRPVDPPRVDPLAPGRHVFEAAGGGRRLGRGTAIAGTPWVMWIELRVEEILRPARDLLWAMTLVGLALLALGGAGAWLIGRRISGPLARATRAAAEIAEGRFAGRLASEGPDELARLSRAFNRMADRVETRTSELQRMRDEYQELYDGCPDAFLSVDGDRRIVRCNATASRRLGHAGEDLVGLALDDLCAPDSRSEIARICAEVASAGAVENARATLLDGAGRKVPMLINAARVRGDDGGGGGGEELRMALRDVTEVERSEARRAAVLHDALDAIVTIDGEGRVVEYNPAAEEMFGYAVEEVRGRTLADLIVPPAQRAAHRCGLERFRESGRGPILGRRLELTALHKSGREFPIELSVVQLESADALLFTGFARDLSHLKRAQHDLERTIADLRRSNEDLEQFAYVASHDLQEPLRMVTLFMEILEREHGDQLEGEAQQYVTYAVEGAERLRRLVDGLLQYSRINTRGRTLARCAAGDVVAEALSNLALRIDETGARVEVGPLPVVWADPTQLQQVFLNLLSNALKFRGAEEPRIAVRARRERDEFVFEVEDNGIGFDAGQEARIFQMFQRLHERRKYEGSGIGLALSKRIVERHGGRMWATSTRGRGSCFRFTMPVAREAAEAGGAAEAEAGAARPHTIGART